MIREGLEGVSTIVVFTYDGPWQDKINRSGTIFKTMATVAQRLPSGDGYCTDMHDVVRLLQQQGFYKELGFYQAHQALAKALHHRKKRRQITHLGDGKWLWKIDPRPHSALGDDHDTMSGSLSRKWSRKAMQQEKYQAWHRESKCMYQVVTLYCGSHKQGIAAQPVGEEHTWAFDHFDMDQVDLRRWTYLTDKHGKDLYTGDLCKLFDWEDAIVQVMWCNNGFYIVSVNSEDLSPQLIPHDFYGTCESVEIIGDIYRNRGISEIYDANGAGGYL